MNNTLSTPYLSKHTSLYETECPYQLFTENKCYAAISPLLLDGNIKEKYCCSDNHDTCPMFISKLLRGRQ